MDTVQERTTYANTILVSKEPYEATETIRIRLSQAKLVNKTFLNLFSELINVKREYTNKLNKIISENEDFNVKLREQMLDSKVLEPKEMENFRFDSLGELNQMWGYFMSELRNETQTNADFYHTIENNIIRSLKDSTENDTKWNESRKLHAKLAQIAADIEMNNANRNPNASDNEVYQSATREWASEGPYLFELFETIDFNRLETLKNALLNYQTTYSDLLLTGSKVCETNMSRFLEFNPESEINRFARDATNYTFIFEGAPVENKPTEKTPTLAPPETIESPTFIRANPQSSNLASNLEDVPQQPQSVPEEVPASPSKFSNILHKNNHGQSKTEKRRSTFGSLVGQRFSSTSSSVANSKDKVSVSNNNSTINSSNNNSLLDLSNNNNEQNEMKNKKTTGRLKSRVGSIFGRNKTKSKKTNNDADQVPDSPLETSSNSTQKAVAVNENRLSSVSTSQSVASSTNNKTEKASKSKQNANNMDHTLNFGSNIASHRPENSPGKQASQKPAPQPTVSRSSSSKNISRPPFQQTEELREHSEASAVVPQSSSPVTKSNRNSHPYSSAAYSKSSVNPQTEANQKQPIQQNLTGPASTQASSRAPSSTTNSSNIPPALPVTISRGNSFGSPGKLDSKSANNSTSQLPMLKPPHRSPGAIMPQITGELKMLAPQTTGSSVLMRNQSLFQHSALQDSNYGLNASIAEVINATFKEGVLTDSQLIGEIALSYIKDESKDTSLPVDINLKVHNISNFEKLILNPSFVEKLDTEDFHVNPTFIDSKTLGAIKFSQKNPVAPIVIHPIWRFEPHQASVVLTIKLAPTIPKHVTKLVLEDLYIFVTIEGANTSSALSKPQGSFSKDKRRITWRFTEPLVLERGKEERMIARFMTDGLAKESSRGISAKFLVRSDENVNFSINSNLVLTYQTIDEDDPFSNTWNDVHTTKTLVAGNYNGLA